MDTQNQITARDTISAKVNQLIIGRMDGPRLAEPAYREKIFALVGKGIGGFILFGGERDETRDFVAELQSRSRLPLFIASDIERGVGQQLHGMTSFPGQMSIAAAINLNDKKDLALFDNAVKTVAAEAKYCGINMALIPVLDVNRDPDNPIICTRAFSDNPEVVASFGSRYVKLLEAEGIISCAKHYPGHGDTSTDSHIALPVITKSVDELNRTDLLPFREAIISGVSSIMIGHLSIPALDSRPASLSSKIVTGLLRNESGFEGLVLTDALDMQALKEYGEVGLECLKAGADILLHPADVYETAASIISAIEDRRLDRQILDLAVSRIFRFKLALKPRSQKKPDMDNNRKLSHLISQKAVTLVKDSAGLLPIKDNRKTCIIFSGDANLYSSSILKNRYSLTGTGDEEISNFDIVIIGIFTSVAAWHGTSGISEAERSRISSILDKAGRTIVISFGSPYVLRYFDSAGMLIAAYDPATQAQQAVINCLEGKVPFTGKLPVTIEPGSKGV
jgi:beta-glucosidase-like glycosyl hydrolase